MSSWLKGLFLAILSLCLLIPFLVWLSPITMRQIRDFVHGMGIHANGHVVNRSNKPLWVIVSAKNHPWAYVLGPGRASPDNLDADAVKTMDGSPINGAAIRPGTN